MNCVCDIVGIFNALDSAAFTCGIALAAVERGNAAVHVAVGLGKLLFESDADTASLISLINGIINTFGILLYFLYVL